MKYPPLALADLDELVFNSQVPVIVYVTGTGAQGLARARREFLAVAKLLQDHIAIYEVDGLKEKAVVSRLDIKGMPSLLLYISGTEAGSLIGFYRRDALEKRIWNLISDS